MKILSHETRGNGEEISNVIAKKLEMKCNKKLQLRE